MNNKTKTILIILLVVIILAVGAVWFFAIPEPAEVPVSAPVAETSDIKEESLTTHYTESELRETINKIAKERFGDDAFVIFLSTEGPSEVEIEGIKRKVYIYAADSASAQKESGNVRGLYHADADTGEIFDNGSGTMEKVIIGE